MTYVGRHRSTDLADSSAGGWPYYAGKHRADVVEPACICGTGRSVQCASPRHAVSS